MREYRQVYAKVPPRVEYRLSPYGQTLQPVLEALCAWGMAHYVHSPPACTAPAALCPAAPPGPAGAQQ